MRQSSNARAGARFSAVLILALAAPIIARQAPPADTAFPADQILQTIRTQSVHRGQFDFAKVEPEIRAKLKDAKSDAEKAAAIVALFARMNDVHSHLNYKSRFYSHYEGVDEATHRKIKPLMDRMRAQTDKVASRLLDGGVGYVLMPAMQAYNAEQVNKLGAELQKHVAELAERKPTGWIVDLRLNGGGNLYPMLAGLRHLLGDNVVGGTINADGAKVQEWVLKSDGLYWRDSAGDRRFAELKPSARTPEPDAPVVVLCGPLTGSSGQATALAFLHRPHCVLMGEPTAKGYTTVINPFAINADTTLSLAVGFMADRTGAPYKEQVLPETILETADDFDDLTKDGKVIAAKEWLKGRKQ